ncbi:Cellulose synthase-like protein D4 [Abeliophyllum distichum]|uniref:Cellulose synthase-like protein D4 n=1 Tax=Abeliophyllum distichum TaxID=126358 RepID=A0ABD1UR29_9LAMI
MSILSNQPSKKAIRTPATVGFSSGSEGNRGSSGQMVKYARRTSSSMYTMGTSAVAKGEEQYVSNSLFAGGFNSVTCVHLMYKIIESEVSDPYMAGSKGSSCAMPAWDGKVMKKVEVRNHGFKP